MVFRIKRYFWMKLIKTKLLKNGNISAAGIATASHFDYCSYRYKGLLEDFTFKDIFDLFVSIITLVFASILAILARLTHGFVLYPIWIVCHIQIKKELIKQHGIDKLNDAANKLINNEDD